MDDAINIILIVIISLSVIILILFFTKVIYFNKLRRSGFQIKITNRNDYPSFSLQEGDQMSSTCYKEFLVIECQCGQNHKMLLESPDGTHKIEKLISGYKS